MQTFLAYPDFAESARVLDRQRLGKQRIEVLQILNALLGDSKGWTNHPATKAWRGYEAALARYGFRVCEEWVKRGYKDTCWNKIFAVAWTSLNVPSDKIAQPPWLGDEKLHASHRAALLYKDPVHYGQFGWVEAPAVPNANGSLPYVWPV